MASALRLHRRMGSYQSPLSAIVKGALAGAAGTYVMGEAMARVPQMLKQAGRPLPPSPPGPTAPDSPTEEVAERLAEGMADSEPLAQEEKATGGQVVHWAYGASWGAVFGVLQASFRLRVMLAGLLFGALVGSVADTVMPRLGLQLAPSDRPGALTAAYMGYHLVYGLTTGVVWLVLNLGRRG